MSASLGDLADQIARPPKPCPQPDDPSSILRTHSLTLEYFEDPQRGEDSKILNDG